MPMRTTVHMGQKGETWERAVGEESSTMAIEKEEKRNLFPSLVVFPLSEDETGSKKRTSEARIST